MLDTPAEAVSKLDEHESSASRPLAPGLYLVATPIGNLEDITLRALRVLRGADLVACEDTRVTQKLLHHFAIQTTAVSLHAHNEASRAGELLAQLTMGARIAVVSDAGTPGISDPGMHLVREALAAGVGVFPIPGANAALAALVASGLGTESFTFYGFLPEKSGARRTKLEQLSAAPGSATLIFYEAPHRILDTLADLTVVWPGARVTLARELTKLHEEFLRGTAAEVRAMLAARDRVRGEMVLLVERAEGDPEGVPQTTVSERMRELMTSEGMLEKEALKQVAREHNMGKSEAYREWQRERGKR